MAPVLWDAGAAAGLASHPGKGVAVPSLIARVCGCSGWRSAALRSSCQSGQTSASLDAERYLGFEFGPISVNRTVCRATAVWVRRAHAIAASGNPLRIAVAQCNARALPVLLGVPGVLADLAECAVVRGGWVSEAIVRIAALGGSCR